MNPNTMTKTELATTLKRAMPSIGIMNKPKRLQAYAYITAFATSFIKDDEKAFDALGELSFICKDFHKSAAEAAMIIPTISKHETDILCPLGYYMANMAAAAHGWQTSPDFSPGYAKIMLGGKQEIFF